MVNKKNDVYSEMMDIDPVLAAKWLDAVPEFQRKIDPKQVKKLVLAITRGEWRPNGATIVFNSKGELIDGQHRLSAIIETGRTLPSIVVTGVSPEESTFHTIGDEKARKITDFVQSANVTVVSGAVRYLWLANNGIWPPTGQREIPPIADLMKLVKKHQDELSDLVHPISPAGRFLGHSSFCVFLCFYYTRIYPTAYTEKVSDFFARVGDGVGLSLNDPAYQLRRRWLNQPTNTRINKTAAMAMIMKALHAYLDGETMSRITFDPNKEAFPSLRGTGRTLEKPTRKGVKDAAEVSA